MSIANPTFTLQLTFTMFFGATYAAVLRKADLWYPFTPTYTDTPGQWMGHSDALRWALAFALLIVLPAIYFSCIQLVIVTYPAVLSSGRLPPTLLDLLRIVLLTFLTLPALGFYNLWQAIVRSYPQRMYSQEYIAKIKSHYQNAFVVRPASAVFLALAYIAGPILLLMIVWASSGYGGV